MNAPNRAPKRDVALSNAGAEKAVIGAVIRSPHSYFQLSLRPDQFFVAVHREIWGVIAGIIESQATLSLPLMLTRLPAEFGDGQSMAAYLAALVHNADGLNAADFSEDISETSARRQALQIADQLAKGIRAGDKRVSEIISESEQALLDVMQSAVPRRPKRLSEINERVMKDAVKAKSQSVLPGYDTGLPSLDEILGRILPGDLGFLIASQKEGKSALASMIGMHVAKNSPVLMFQLEMGDEQIAAREMAAASGISVRQINEGSFDAFEWDKLKQVEQQLKGPEMWILDAEEITVREMRSHCLAMMRTIGLGVVIVDQLDKLRAAGKYRDRFDRANELTRDLKNLAKSLRVPILTLAQRTRGAQRREDAAPDILDTDFPSIERDCDWTIGLWRKFNWLQRNRPHASAGGEAWDKWEAEVRACKETAEVTILAHRRMQTHDKRSLKWIGPITRFAELNT
jgi:replicative DNA helicase